MRLFDNAAPPSSYSRRTLTLVRYDPGSPVRLDSLPFTSRLSAESGGRGSNMQTERKGGTTLSTETIIAAAKAETEEADVEPNEDAAEEQAEREREEDAAAAEDEETETAPEEPSDVAHEKRMALLDSETKRHRTRIASIMGDDFEGVDTCPMCISPGVVFPFNPDDPFDAERRQLVEAYFDAGAAELREAPDSVRCPTCDGWGELLSHSRRADQRAKVCDTCGARGWILKAELQAREDASRYTQVNPGATGEVPPPPQPETVLAVDPSHPNYQTIRALLGGGSGV